MLTFILRCRRMLIIGIHVSLISLASYLACRLRITDVLPQPYMTHWMQILPWIVIIRGLTFIPFRLYEGLWRYTGIWDLRNIIAGVVISTVLFFMSILVLGFSSYP